MTLLTDALETIEREAEKNGPSPALPRFERRGDGRLWAVPEEGDAQAVRVRRAFPWTAPDRLITVRNDDDEEVALIPSVSALDEASREVVEAALAETNFTFQVEAVMSIELEFEIRQWKVRTRQGEMRFQTKHDDWPFQMKDGGLLVRSLTGDLFQIPDPNTMDPRSMKLLWAYTD